MSHGLAPSLAEKDFERILEIGEEMAARAGTDLPGPRFLSEPSSLPFTSKPVKASTGILTVDVGGTHTRVALREADSSATVRWIELLDVDNDDLDTGSSPGKALARMMRALAERIDNRLKECSIARAAVRGIGVVWSNNLRTRPLELRSDGISGVTGMVMGVSDGSSYRKGEWFNEDLVDSDDIGQIIYTAYSDVGIPIEAFVIGNDSVFTFKVVAKADAGIVASTGANGTIIPRSGDRAGKLCNAESGGCFTVPGEMVSPADVLDDRPVKLEDLLAGMGLARRFTGYVQSLANHEEALKPCLEQDEFVNQEVSLLLNRKYGDLLEWRPSSRDWRQETLAALTLLAERLMGRAGKLAAALVYFSIYNQVEEKDEFVISLDSSQARHNPHYRQTMENTLSAILSRRSKSARIELIEPPGDVTVPHMGAARAVNDFLPSSRT